MHRIRVGLAAAVVGGSLLAGLGAAPAPTSFVHVESTIRRIRNEWQQANAPQALADTGWNAFFDGLLADLNAYRTAPNEAEQLRALGRLYEKSNQLATVPWGPAAEVRQALDGWLQPRTGLAWAVRRLEDAVTGLPAGGAPAAEENRQQWLTFLRDDLGAGLREYEGAQTVGDRVAAIDGVQERLQRMRANPQSIAWGPSWEVYNALQSLFFHPNVEATIDFPTASSFLSRQIVQQEVIYRQGQYSYVTPGPYLGFGLVPSNDGIGFVNQQVAYSYTPIQGFQNQIAADPRGQRAAKMYNFSAATQTTTTNTAVTMIRTNGIDLNTNNQPSVGFGVTACPQPGGGFGRFFAGLLGYSKERIAQEVYENALPRVQAEAAQGAKELAAERTASAEVNLNSQARQYLVGNNTAVYGPVAVTALALRSQPQYAWAQGNVQWRTGTVQSGADVPQPPSLATIGPGVSADLHLPSLAGNLAEGYLQGIASQGINNVMIETRDVPEGTPLANSIQLTNNADDAAFLAAIDRAKAANNPKVTVFRIHRPSKPPVLAADRDGNLVVVFRDLTIEAAPPSGAQAQRVQALQNARYVRIVAPQAEVALATTITPPAGTDPMRLQGKVVGFDPGVGTRIYTVNDDPANPTPLNAITNALALGLARTRVQNQEFALPLSQVQLPGFYVQSVSPLDPSGWMRVTLAKYP